MKKTKIICSIGPASCTYETMLKMVNAGMNVARINFSHATNEERDNVISVVEKIRKENNKFVGILFDTKGPEFRSGMLENDEISLVEGKTIRVVKEDVLGTEERITVNHPKAIDSLTVGDVILLENDLMRIEVISKEDDGVTCKIINGGILGNKKSISVPGVKLDIPFVSENDYNDIMYACTHGGEFLALSFVSNAKEVLEVKEILKNNNREDLKIICKIENVMGVENVQEILEVSDGVMVARGDLGVEVPVEKLPHIQKYLIEKCRENGKIAIVATEMMESMKKNPRPTRAEVSDVANAVLNGTDAIMLSGESTIGKFPVETVSFMNKICIENEKYYDYEADYNYVVNHVLPFTIARSVKTAANDIEAKLVVAATLSGYTARKISNLKVKAPIMAACNDLNVAYSLSLNYGVYPRLIGIEHSMDDLISSCLEIAKNEFNLLNGDKVVLTGGRSKSDKKVQTNFLTVEEI